MRRHHRLCSFFALLIAASCASTEDETEAADVSVDPLVGEQVDRICFRRQINGFTDWEQGLGIILQRGVNDQFLVTFQPPCQVANRALRVGLNSRFATSGCVEEVDPIFLSDSLTPSRIPFSSQRCIVDGIYEYDVDDDEDAAAEDDTP